MKISVTQVQLMQLGLNPESANRLLESLSHLPDSTPEHTWQTITTRLLTSDHPFPIHAYLFSLLFPHRQDSPHTALAWIPNEQQRESANITAMMKELAIHDLTAFHQWSTEHYTDFWQKMVTRLNILFQQAPEQICDLSHGIESPSWFAGSRLNITDSCFNAPATATAILYNQGKVIQKMTYGELNTLSNRIANSLLAQGLMAGDAIGIAMPMNQFAVAIYLGIIKMGGIVVSIADSFSSQEIAMRINISDAKALFTQDVSPWGGKPIPLYEKVKQAAESSLHSFKIFVLLSQTQNNVSLRKEDCTWDDFLVSETSFTSVACHPMAACNILFSSGTTAEPKAIPWNHTTPIKAASDAYLHQNIQPHDVLAWPTNLGWMMGPWLIFASLINQATIALYNEAPKDRAFGEFIQDAKVTMLGVVPTLVAYWRQTHCMEKLDWQTIKVFSSTGECSNAEDMLYLMSLAQYKPIIEYCGGTEIGGAYLSSTVVQANCPAVFSTPAMGTRLSIIDEEGNPANTGEVALVPPSIGLSTLLLNADHHYVYYENMPTTPYGQVLRRHGDQIKQYPNHYYSVFGRVDDTMKLGGIKTSSAEIERTLVGIPHIVEVAAIALPPENKGPNQLIIFASTLANAEKQLDKQHIIQEMQKKINAELNPLFKIHDLIFVSDLPKTASNKIMRRVLRKQYQDGLHTHH